MMWIHFKHKVALTFMRFWPPLFGTGFRVTHFSKELNSITVGMPLSFYNRNIVGVHFGGSLYSMCDPFYMYILMIHLGSEYIVWDKSAEIKFIKPGRKRVSATFEISLDQIAEIKRIADTQEKYEPVFTAKIKDEDGLTVATVNKVIYVKKKPSK